jgi:hypothetical protein
MAGTSALLKSAASVRNQLATYQDAVKAFEYSNSAYTDSAFSDYKSYLQQRIDSLNSSPSISNASKALSLTKALDSAGKSNISATIQRENIQMLSGNASLQDKYGVVVDQYTRAYSNGDMTLAQSLMSQAYSISQSIQLQAQQAADAQVTLAKSAEAAAKQGASDQVSIGDHLTDSLKQLNNDIKTVGVSDFNKTVQKWTQANKDTLESLGVKLPNQPNYWDVVQGVAGAQYNHYMLASQAYAPYGSGFGSQSWDAAQKANAINSGVTSLPTLAGSISLQEVMQAAANPSEYVYNPTQGKFVQTQITGQAPQFDKQAGGGPSIQNTYSGTVAHAIVLQASQVTQMNKLGLKFAGTTNKDGSVGDGIQVQATGATPAWLQQVLGKNGVTNMYAGPNNELSFSFDDPTKQSAADKQLGLDPSGGQAVYHVVSDANGKLGLYYQGQTSEGFIRGDSGFNPNATKTQATMNNGSSFGFGNFTTNMSNWFGGLEHGAGRLFGGLMGHASADGLLNAATSHYQLPPIPIAQPAPLPNISLPQPAPLPNINVAPQVANTQSVIPHTVSVQGNNNVQVQGGGFNQQQGGNGIRITGTTNGPVGMRI